MTTKPDLLPLRDWMECLGEANAEDIRDYARANVAHATAAKDAEVEALRAEVEDYRTNGAAAVRFAPNSAYWSNELRRLFGDDARTGIEVLENQYRQELTRAERLAEALDIIARVGKASRNKTTRTRWIVARAISALNGDEDWQALPKPKGFHDALLHPTAAQENDDA